MEDDKLKMTRTTPIGGDSLVDGDEYEPEFNFMPNSITFGLKNPHKHYPKSGLWDPKGMTINEVMEKIKDMNNG